MIYNNAVCSNEYRIRLYSKDLRSQFHMTKKVITEFPLDNQAKIITSLYSLIQIHVFNKTAYENILYSLR